MYESVKVTLCSCLIHLRFTTTGDVAKWAEEQQVGCKDIEGVAANSVSRINVKMIELLDGLSSGDAKDII
jgi:hypothetical protein